MTALRHRWPSIRFTLDPGLLATMALCLFTLWPLLRQGGLPNGTDVLYHVYRAAEMDRSWSHGVLTPTWAEGLYYGYGSPLFHYYASLTYYLTSILARLFGFDAVNSLRAVIALCMLGGGAGMYLFVKQRAGPLAGAIAAAVYVYSPYLLSTEPYGRGDYPELLAFAVFPFVMWRFERLLQRPGAMNLTLAALAVALLILSHNLMAVVLFAVLAASLVWGLIVEIVFARGRGDLPGRPYRPYVIAFIAVLLGVGLAAFFWMPVLLEQGEVKLANLTAVALLDYRNFFMLPGQLLAPSPRADAGALNGLLHRLNLGPAQWAMALVGLIGVIVAARRPASLHHRLRLPVVSQTLFFALAAAGMIFLMLPSGVWERLTALSLLQFPWRFLGPVVFCLAALAGTNAVWIERLPARWGAIAAALAIVLPVALALPMLYVPEWIHRTVDTSLAAYHQAEVLGLQRGTTFTNEYLPRYVEVLASETSWLLDDYADGYPVDRANRASLPAGATVELLDNGPQHNLWCVVTPVPFTMEVLTFHFAGWTAEIDGARVEITPTVPHGFITFPVPAGEHTVRLYMGSTPARDLGRAITALAAVGIVGLGWYLRKSHPLSPGPFSPLQIGEGTGVRSDIRIGLLLGFVVNAALVVLFMREGLAWVNSPPGTALLAGNPVTYNLGDRLQLIGYDLSGREFRPGERLELVVYWYAREPLPYNYQSFVHVSSGGPPLAQADKQHPAGRPSTRWTPDGYIRDEYTLFLPESMPPGEYQLLVGLYTCETLPPEECGNGDRLPVTDSDGNPLGDAIPLATVIVH